MLYYLFFHIEKFTNKFINSTITHFVANISIFFLFIIIIYFILVPFFIKFFDNFAQLLVVLELFCILLILQAFSTIFLCLLYSIINFYKPNLIKIRRLNFPLLSVGLSSAFLSFFITTLILFLYL